MFLTSEVPLYGWVAPAPGHRPDGISNVLPRNHAPPFSRGILSTFSILSTVLLGRCPPHSSTLPSNVREEEEIYRVRGRDTRSSSAGAPQGLKDAHEFLALPRSGSLVVFTPEIDGFAARGYPSRAPAPLTLLLLLLYSRYRS